jgi:hypothetical protein
MEIAVLNQIHGIQILTLHLVVDQTMEIVNMVDLELIQVLQVLQALVDFLETAHLVGQAVQAAQVLEEIVNMEDQAVIQVIIHIRVDQVVEGWEVEQVLLNLHHMVGKQVDIVILQVDQEDGIDFQ